MKNLTVFALLCFITYGACKKEPNPNIYGHWKTISALGDQWEYDIDRTGLFCKSLPPYFGTTFFCWPYRENGDTLFIDKPEPEVWIWHFEAPNVATVTNHLGTTEQPKTFILRR